MKFGMENNFRSRNVKKINIPQTECLNNVKQVSSKNYLIKDYLINVSMKDQNILKIYHIR